MAVEREYIFIDESGDPGAAGTTPIYILVALHADEGALTDLRGHLTSFRYHTPSKKEFKAARWADKAMTAGDGTDRLLTPLAHLAEDGHISVTAIWIDKEKYKVNRGPYLAGNPGDTTKFRHFQLRQLLELHVTTHQWGEATDLVIDRWAMSHDNRQNLEKYIRENYNLRPTPWITLIDSVCCDYVQVVDIINRLVRRCVTGKATEADSDLCQGLVDLHEIVGGRY